MGKRGEMIYYIKMDRMLQYRGTPQNTNCVIAFTVVFFQTFGLVLVPLWTHGGSRRTSVKKHFLYSKSISRDVTCISKGSKYSGLPRIYSFSFRAIILAVLFDLLAVPMDRYAKLHNCWAPSLHCC